VKSEEFDCVLSELGTNVTLSYILMVVQ